MSDFTDAEDERRRYCALQLAVQFFNGPNTAPDMTVIDISDRFVNYLKNGTVA